MKQIRNTAVNQEECDRAEEVAKLMVDVYNHLREHQNTLAELQADVATLKNKAQSPKKKPTENR